jgi:nicotinamide-nucleotide amidase
VSAREDWADGLLDKADALVAEAKRRGLTLATAESCTGGALAVLLSNAPGAGDIFHGGFVVYTKANKTAALGVPADLIKQHTAVSAEIAKAMADGALQRCPADVVLAVTGVAGPEPDEDGNPVGLVHLATARRDGTVLHEEHRFPARGKEQLCDTILDRCLSLLAKAIGAKTGS